MKTCKILIRNKLDTVSSILSKELVIDYYLQVGNETIIYDHIKSKVVKVTRFDSGNFEYILEEIIDKDAKSIISYMITNHGWKL